MNSVSMMADPKIDAASMERVLIVSSLRSLESALSSVFDLLELSHSVLLIKYNSVARELFAFIDPKCTW